MLPFKDKGTLHNKGLRVKGRGPLSRWENEPPWKPCDLCAVCRDQSKEQSKSSTAGGRESQAGNPRSSLARSTQVLPDISSQPSPRLLRKAPKASSADQPSRQKQYFGVTSVSWENQAGLRAGATDLFPSPTSNPHSHPRKNSREGTRLQ